MRHRLISPRLLSSIIVQGSLVKTCFLNFSVHWIEFEYRCLGWGLRFWIAKKFPAVLLLPLLSHTLLVSTWMQ